MKSDMDIIAEQCEAIDKMNAPHVSTSDVVNALKDTHRHIEALYALKQGGCDGLDRAYLRAELLTNFLLKDKK